jgi:hypothetical protein
LPRASGVTFDGSGAYDLLRSVLELAVAGSANYVEDG